MSLPSPDPQAESDDPALEAANKVRRRRRTSDGRSDYRRSGWLGALAIIVLVCIAYGSLLGSNFLWSDYDQVERSSYQSLDHWTDAWTLESIRHTDPISLSTYFLETAIPLPTAPVHRAINIILHICAAILVLRMLEQLKLAGALSTALIFALHPSVLQTIFWPGYRNEIIGLIAILITLYFGLKPVSRRNILIYTVCGSIAALIHPAGLALPLILGGVILYRQKRFALQNYNPILPLLLCCLYIGLWIEPALLDPPKDLAFAEYVYLLGQSMFFFIKQSLTPFQIELFYPLKESLDGQQGGFLGLLPFFLFVPFFILFAFNIKRRWSRALILALGSYLLLLLYGLMQIGRFIDGTPAQEDHFLYVALPSILIFIIIGLSHAAQKGSGGLRFLWRLLLLMTMIVSIRTTAAYSYKISAPVRMWQELRTDWPNCWQAQAAYVEAVNQSDSDLLSVGGQIDILDSILEKNPDLMQQRIALARILRENRQRTRALREYQHVIRENEPDRAFMLEAAVFYDEMGLSWEANRLRQRIQESSQTPEER